jgi:hypothetical protein
MVAYPASLRRPSAEWRHAAMLGGLGPPRTGERAASNGPARPPGAVCSRCHCPRPRPAAALAASGAASCGTSRASARSGAPSLHRFAQPWGSSRGAGHWGLKTAFDQGAPDLSTTLIALTGGRREAAPDLAAIDPEAPAPAHPRCAPPAASGDVDRVNAKRGHVIAPQGVCLQRLIFVWQACGPLADRALQHHALASDFRQGHRQVALGPAAGRHRHQQGRAAQGCPPRRALGCVEPTDVGPLPPTPAFGRLHRSIGLARLRPTGHLAPLVPVPAEPLGRLGRAGLLQHARRRESAAGTHQRRPLLAALCPANHGALSGTCLALGALCLAIRGAPSVGHEAIPKQRLLYRRRASRPTGFDRDCRTSPRGLAHHPRTLPQGRALSGTGSPCCPPHPRLAPPGRGTTPARAAGSPEPDWSVQAWRSSQVPPPRWTPPPAARASLPCTQGPGGTMGRRPRVAVELPLVEVTLKIRFSWVVVSRGT